MILSRLTWPEVEALNRERMVVLIPTGSFEQHGPHLPLFTDSLMATAVANAVEHELTDQVVLTPTLWLGASGHHLGFPGTLSASFEAYELAIVSVVESLLPHGFRTFYLVNGHGGNNEPNGVTLRKLKMRYPNAVFGHRSYYEFLTKELLEEVIEGPMKNIAHACEVEVSLMLHLHPDLVRQDRLRDDGLRPDGPAQGAVLHFDEITEQGSFGYATLASAEKGSRLFQAAVQGVCEEIRYFAQGLLLKGLPSKS